MTAAVSNSEIFFLLRQCYYGVDAEKERESERDIKHQYIQNIKDVQKTKRLSFFLITFTVLNILPIKLFKKSQATMARAFVMKQKP